MSQKTKFKFSAGAIGAIAIGSFAVGALAIGALAIGRLAIGRFAVGKGKLGSLEIGELTVRRLKVKDLRWRTRSSCLRGKVGSCGNRREFEWWLWHRAISPNRLKKCRTAYTFGNSHHLNNAELIPFGESR